jgi:hypothetical protein
VTDATAREPGAQATADDSDDERALFFGISAARLRGRVVWASVLMVASVLLPHDVVGGSPQFVWDIASELAPAPLLAALALPIAGVAMLVARFATRRATSLAAVCLGALLPAAIVKKLGAERSEWDAFSLPDTLSSRPAGALLSLGLVAAAANLSFRPHTRRATPIVVGAAVASALYYYAWPARGEAPLVLVWRALKFLPELPGLRYQLGSIILVFIALWPLVVTLAGGALVLSKPAKKDESWLALVANWGLSFWLFMLAYRALAMSQATVGLLTYLGTILLVTAAIVLVSASVAAMVEGLYVGHGDLAPPSRARPTEIEPADPFREAAAIAPRVVEVAPGLSPKAAISIAAGIVVALAAGLVAIARPPEKAPAWDLDPPSDAADEVFGQRLIQWGIARQNWDFGVRHEGGAAQRLEVKSSAKGLVDQAKAVDAGLGAAFVTLTDESDDLDLAGRKFARLVAGVNDASRAAKLPYFVDASVMYRQTDDGMQRHFFAYAYKVEQVRRFEVDGAERAALRVRPLGHDRDGHVRLGFSRDADPYALVVLSVTDASAADMAASAAIGDCTDQPVGHMELYGGLGECGRVVKDAFAGREREVREGVVLGTERHELQHQIDGPHLPIATGVRSRLEGYALDYQDRVSREVSAFLAELTADGLAPKLGLWQLVRYQLASEQGTYPRTALVVLEALAGRSLLRGYVVDGEALWRAWHELFAMSDDELRARARKAWGELFDGELAEPKPI